MHFHMSTAEIFVPDGLPADQALMRTTHLAISAHQDDLEIMAAGAILECYQRQDQWFTGVVATDGRGSPRAGLYENYTDEEMRTVRFREQKKAAVVGEYAAQVLLDYPSKAIKDGSSQQPVEDLAALLRACQPRVVFTHNLADKHDTHVGVALKVIAAIRSLPQGERPEKLYGCEVWRDLDWMVDADKVAFQLDEHENIAASLVGVFDSQIAGGKRYDLATLSRRRAHATYHQSHAVDTAQMINFGMDLTPLIENPSLDPAKWVLEFIERFAGDVEARIRKSQ
jgi:LmbE family N-acetylglucosaminyl deacetylase